MAFPRSMGNRRYGTTPSGRFAARLPKFARLCGYPLMICSLAPRMVQGPHGTPGQPEHRSPDQCEKNAFNIMSLGPAPSAALGE